MCSPGSPRAKALKATFLDLSHHYRELESLMQLGSHANIVRLVGRAQIPLGMLQRHTTEKSCVDKDALEAHSDQHGPNATIPAIVLQRSSGLSLGAALEALQPATCVPEQTPSNATSHTPDPTTVASLLWDGILGVAHGLQHVHARHVIHNDLTAHNVLLPGPPWSVEPILIDFSLAALCPGPTMVTAAFRDVFLFGTLLDRLCYGQVRREHRQSATFAQVDVRPRTKPSETCQAEPIYDGSVRTEHEELPAVNRCAEPIREAMDNLVKVCTSRASKRNDGGNRSRLNRWLEAEATLQPFTWDFAIWSLSQMRSRSPQSPLASCSMVKAFDAKADPYDALPSAGRNLTYKLWNEAFSASLEDQLDLTGVLQCGESKCFVPAKTNGTGESSSASQSAIGHGFLISPDADRKPRWDRAWILANNLSARGASHVLLSPPLDVHVSNASRAALNRTSLNWEVSAAPISHRFSNCDRILVQKARDCQYPQCVLLGCIPKKLRFFRERLPGFLDRLGPASRGALLSALGRNLNATRTLLIDEEPCLRPDFQAFLTRDGRLLHVDLDRCFEAPLKIHVNLEQCFLEVLGAIQDYTLGP